MIHLRLDALDAACDAVGDYMEQDSPADREVVAVCVAAYLRAACEHKVTRWNDAGTVLTCSECEADVT